MPPIALSSANQLNVEATLNKWFEDRMAEFALPSWLSATPRVVFEFPVAQAVMPCWSLTHIPVSGNRRSTGDVTLQQIGVTTNRGEWRTQFVRSDVAEWSSDPKS